eukprot:evm.model.NODE_1259_length_1803_cov_43.824181.1
MWSLSTDITLENPQGVACRVAVPMFENCTGVSPRSSPGVCHKHYKAVLVNEHLTSSSGSSHQLGHDGPDFFGTSNSDLLVLPHLGEITENTGKIVLQTVVQVGKNEMLRLYLVRYCQARGMLQKYSLPAGEIPHRLRDYDCRDHCLIVVPPPSARGRRLLPAVDQALNTVGRHLL